MGRSLGKWPNFQGCPFSILNKLVLGKGRATKSFKQMNHKTNNPNSVATRVPSMIYDNTRDTIIVKNFSNKLTVNRQTCVLTILLSVCFNEGCAEPKFK